MALISCKEDNIDASLIKNSYYEEYVNRNYPDLPIDTFKYYFKGDTLTAIGYIYENVNNLNVPIKKDTQNYFYYTKGPLLYVQNIEIQEQPDHLIESPNYVGITRNAEWKIINLSKEKVEIDFIHYNNELVGHTVLWAHK